MKIEIDTEKIENRIRLAWDVLNGEPQEVKETVPTELNLGNLACWLKSNHLRSAKLYWIDDAFYVDVYDEEGYGVERGGGQTPTQALDRANSRINCP